ncbi:hypothetical protein AB1K83_09110 [Sporosarcina sp. 179-K 3D1 HS]|uniref:hypothetical protein n=1 Tax=Sporosarcina sp. 179-K 3D1 HS TaxID=3232169 RepID=UPI0039A3029A
MRKKSIELNKEQNEKRLRIVKRFLIIAGIIAIIGSGIIAWNRSVTDLYTAFVLDFIGMSFLCVGALILCSFFLYLIFVIVVFNPQRIKKSSVIKFALGGIVTLLITILLLLITTNEARKSIQDMKDYSNGEWQVKDLLVTDVYRGTRRSTGVLIETSEGDMKLHWESFLIYEGQKYRFTYLEATNTILNVEVIRD